MGGRKIGNYHPRIISFFALLKFKEEPEVCKCLRQPSLYHSGYLIIFQI